MSLVDGWRKGISLTDANRYMFENSVCFDTRFVFSSGEPDVRAHRYILVLRSPVFETMLNGSYKETSGDYCTIDITDIERSTFNDIIRYLYSEEITLSLDNVLQVLYAAKKYILEDLVAKCVEFLRIHISPDNVCSMLNDLLLYGSTDPVHICQDFITAHAQEVLQNDDFLNLTETTLNIILQDDGPFDEVNETDILDACLRWADHKRITSPTDTVRELLGKGLYNIRFCHMDAKSLADFTEANPSVLTDQEENAIMRHLANGRSVDKLIQFGFNVRKRHLYKFMNKCTVCVRFLKVGHTNGWEYCKNDVDQIILCTDHDIRLHGIGLFGGCVENDEYIITISVYEVEVDQKIYEKHIECGSYGTTDPFVVRIEPFLRLNEGKRYRIELRMAGPKTYYGLEGRSSVAVDGVTFKFDNVPVKMTRTSVETGQLPYFAFTKAPLVTSN